MHAIDGMACAKRGCDTRGNLGLNIVGHGSCPTKWGRRWRYRCTVCGGNGQHAHGDSVQRPSLRSEGIRPGREPARRGCEHVCDRPGHGPCPQSLARWLERASTAAKRFNQRMLRDFEIIELQADERCTFIGNKSRATWLCAAIEVCSRLWAGSVLGRRSSRNATAVLNDVILRGRVVIFPGESGQVDYAAHVTFRTCRLSNALGLRYPSDECSRYGL